jgi:hypothetical protein
MDNESPNSRIASDALAKAILSECRPSYLTTDRTEIRVRCPYCGDSHTHSGSAHMYVSLKPPFFYHCFKCEAGGVVNAEFLRDIGVYDSSLSLQVEDAAKEGRPDRRSQPIQRKRRSFDLTPDSPEAVSTRLAYLNGRLGTDLTAEEAMAYYSCVLDPKAFISKNRLDPKAFFDFGNSIGFLSADRGYAIFRDTSGKQGKRYTNLRLADEDDEASKIFSVALDPEGGITTDPSAHLVVAEGIFDIMGICEGLYRKSPSDGGYRFKEGFVFAACCGKGYPAVIKRCFRSLGMIGAPIDIYSDGDVQPDFYRQMLSDDRCIAESEVTLHYNGFAGEKDFGVPFSKISEKQLIIL